MSGEGRTLGDVQAPRSPHPASPHAQLHQMPESEAINEPLGQEGVLLRVRGPTSDAVGDVLFTTSEMVSIGVVKDKLATLGLGDRDGMRIVWSGKFLEDEKFVGQFFAARSEAYTVHLVARKNPNPPAQAHSAAQIQRERPLYPSATAFSGHLASPTRPGLSISPVVPPAPSASTGVPLQADASLSEASAETTSQPTTVQGTSSSSTRRKSRTGQAGLTAAQQLATAEAAVRSSGDALHFFYFLIREHLSQLLDQPPLEWYETVPKPVISREDAQCCVDDLLRHWELDVPWDMDDTQDISVTDLSLEWCNATHLSPSRRETNSLLIEIDGLHYQLVLPGIEALPQDVRRRLSMYFRLTRAAETMETIYESSNFQFKSLAALATNPYANTPTITRVASPILVRLQDGQRAREEAGPFLTLLVSILPLSMYRLLPLVPSLTKTALKIAALIWMLTRDMAWSDQNFILIALVGFAYLCYSIQSTITVAWARYEENDRARARALLGRATPRPSQAPATPAAVAPESVTPVAVTAQEETVMELFNRRRTDMLLTRPAVEQIPHFHLPTDNSVLNLRHRTIVAPAGDPTSRDILLATMFPAIGSRHPRGQRFSWLRTYLFIPLVLWFVTLVPSWETVRRKEIRRRENEIRKSSDVLVKDAERDLAQIKQRRELAELGKIPVEQVEAEERALREAGMDLETGHGMWSRPISLEGDDKKYAIPTNLSPQAERYWRRVLARAQTVDWEEEREAQERLGRGNEAPL